MITVPSRVVCSPSEKRNPERRAGDDHDFALYPVWRAAAPVRGCHIVLCKVVRPRIEKVAVTSLGLQKTGGKITLLRRFSDRYIATVS